MPNSHPVFDRLSAIDHPPPSTSSLSSAVPAPPSPPPHVPDAAIAARPHRPASRDADAPATPSAPAPPAAPAATANGVAAAAAAPASQRNPLNVVITGGSNGIGAATVRAFANSGHRVLFTYLTGYPRARELQSRFPNTTPVHLDQGDIASVARFARAAAAWADGRGVDVLINNAALGSATVDGYVAQRRQRQQQQPAYAPTAACNGDVKDDANTASDDCSADCKTNGDLHVNGEANDSETLSDSASATHAAVERVVQRAAADEALLKVNALGPLWVTDALIELIRHASTRSNPRRASVIFIGSVGGGSSAVFPEYCPADLMSKAAMTYLSKHVAARYVRDPIDVTCVSPGATETEMFRKSTLSKVDDVDMFVDSMPKRRLIQPEDVASTICWLATQSPPGLFHGANLDASMGLAVRPGLQTETENRR